HRSEGLVAWRVEERDLLIVDLDLVGANVLGDSTRFLSGDVRLTNGVEQTGLTVVDVSEDRDDRRSWSEVFLLFDLGGDNTLAGVKLLGSNLDVERARHVARGREVDTLIDRDHESTGNEFFDDLAAAQVERLG